MIVRQMVCLFSITLLIGGCVSIAKTPEQMRENGFAKVEACFERSSEDVALFLEAKFRDCDERSTSNGLLINNDIWVESKILDNGTHMVSLVQKANWNKFYMQLVEITETDSCPAFVTVYGMNDIENWFKESQSVLDWIEAWNAQC